MRPSYEVDSLVQYIIDNKCYVSVGDHGGFMFFQKVSAPEVGEDEIFDALVLADRCTIHIYDSEGKTRIGWADIGEIEEYSFEYVITDHSSTEFLMEWRNHFNKEGNEYV